MELVELFILATLKILFYWLILPAIAITLIIYFKKINNAKPH